MNTLDQNHSPSDTQSPQVNELMTALAKAQGRITNALKDKKNPFFKSSYADLSSVWDSCRMPLSDNGLSVIQTIEGSRESLVLVTCLGHSSGQWIKSRMPLFLMKQDPQSLGSALTYGRRYALSAIVGVCADEDDDGEKAMGQRGVTKPNKDTSPKVSPQQASEILMILGDCDPKHTENVMKSLQQQGVNSISELTPELYQRVKIASLKNMEETRAKQKGTLPMEMSLAEAS
jgi:hypothetical protein